MEQFKSAIGKEKARALTATVTGKTAEELEDIVFGDEVHAGFVDNGIYAKAQRLVRKGYVCVLAYMSQRTLNDLEHRTRKVARKSDHCAESVCEHEKKLTYAEILRERYSNMNEELDTKISELEVELNAAIKTASANIEDDTYLAKRDELTKLQYDKRLVGDKLNKVERIFVREYVRLGNQQAKKASADVAINTLQGALIETELVTAGLQEGVSEISPEDIISVTQNAYRAAKRADTVLRDTQERAYDGFEMLKKMANKPHKLEVSAFGQKMIEDASEQKNYLSRTVDELIKKRRAEAA